MMRGGTVHWHDPVTGDRGELYFPDERQTRNFSSMFRADVDVLIEWDTE